MPLDGTYPGVEPALIQPAVIAAYGGGVDSTAMLIEMIERGERVDQVLFADTGSEKPATYAYVQLFAAWLRARGVPFEVVRYEPKNFKHYPAYRTLEENVLSYGSLPSLAFGFGSCSQKWKTAPQNAWTKNWDKAIATWAAGGKVVKLIGFDCSPADQRRYAEREGYEDSKYEFRYPLREWGWTRVECAARIEAAGLSVPPKSACFMCPATKPHELHEMPKALLRRIVLMEARAKPRLTSIDGLWRKPVKGLRGATPRPGSMTEYIRDKGLLEAADMDRIIEATPAGLVAFQAEAARLPIEQRPELSEWLKLFDLRDQSIFEVADATPVYGIPIA